MTFLQVTNLIREYQKDRDIAEFTQLHELRKLKHSIKKVFEKLEILWELCKVQHSNIFLCKEKSYSLLKQEERNTSCIAHKPNGLINIYKRYKILEIKIFIVR